MARPSWLVDGNRIATKIKSASGSCDHERAKWSSNPTRACPKCQHVIDNSDIAQEWPGLPKGVKFDPTDQEIIRHLLAKVGLDNVKPHPFIDEFISTVNEDDGICYTHPQRLPGVKQDGSVSHFFHRAVKAYNTGTRKRRKIHGDDCGDVRWHKTGRTKPVILDGVQRGCKKIMVLYVSTVKGGKSEKTNWVMHQYHLGTGEDEKDGEYVISKIFHQQQVKQADKIELGSPETIETGVTKVDPVTPKSVTPEPPRTERRCGFDNELEPPMNSIDPFPQHPEMECVEDEVYYEINESNYNDDPMAQSHVDQIIDNNDHHDNEDQKWWDSESQHLLNTQELVEKLDLCEDLLQSQSPNRDCDNEGSNGKPRLSDYAHLGAEHFKKDIEECHNLSLDSANIVPDTSPDFLLCQSPNRDCDNGGSTGKPSLSGLAQLGAGHFKDIEQCQNLVLDPANIELDTPPDFRLSQLEFASQDSFIAWGGSKVID